MPFDPFGELLKRQRYDHNLTLRDVADALCVTAADASAWENGRKRPTLDWVDFLYAYRFDTQEMVQAATALYDMPLIVPPISYAALVHVSWAHDSTLGDACSCNECRIAWFDKHLCDACHGDGLRPGAPEKPDDPREVARLAKDGPGRNAGATE